MIVREVVQDPPAAQRLGVVHDRLETQHVFAFGVGLQRQVPEVELEQGQVEPRCLDHGGELQGQVGGAVAAGALFGAEQGPQDRHVQPGAGAVDHPVEHLVHLGADGEQQVAAVLGLVDRIAVAEPAACLLGQVQAEAQAGGVDPPITHLGQAPYRRGLRQGVCDLGQGGGVGDAGEAVALLDEPDPARPGGGGDVLVAVEDDLRAERWMPGHFDRHVSPLRVQDVEGVVVDEGPLLGQVAQHPAGRAGDLPHRGDRAGDQDQEHPALHLVGGQVLLGDLVLAFPALAVDHRDAVRTGRGADPAGEPPGHPHQVRVVQLLVVTMQAPPPGPEPARVVAQRVVGVEHDPIHTVVAAVEKIAVALAEPVGHPGRFPSAAPPGATDSEQRLGIGLRYFLAGGCRVAAPWCARRRGRNVVADRASGPIGDARLHGLHVVSALARNWGVTEQPDAKIV